jgi:hypothetical protein
VKDFSGGEGIRRRRGQGGEVREEGEGVLDWWIQTGQRGGVLGEKRYEGCGIEWLARGWFL